MSKIRKPHRFKLFRASSPYTLEGTSHLALYLILLLVALPQVSCKYHLQFFNHTMAEISESWLLEAFAKDVRLL